MECVYCNESDEHTVIIPKPAWFLSNGVGMQLVDENKPVCIKCLEFEVNELKEVG
jgi:hypothetical protein